MTQQIGIIFFGTSAFALPALNRIAADPSHKIAAVITQPDKPAGRKQLSRPSPVKIAARELGLEIIQPEKLNAYRLPLTADLFIVASYGKIIPKSILDISKHGALNIHPSLLPKYRGPSPIQAAILNGDRETGVTIMRIDEEMDHGPILDSRKQKIENRSYQELHDMLAEMGAELLIHILPDYLAGKIKPRAQDHNEATYTKIITKDNGRINWSNSGEEIGRHIRAYSSWPVAWTMLNGKRLKIFYSAPSPHEERAGVRVGTIELQNSHIQIHCGSGRLEILSLQIDGGKRMSASQFLRGHPGLAGEILK